MSKKEKLLYNPIMKALKRVFSSLGICHLEITGDPKHFTNKLKKQFSKYTLLILRIEGFYPDLTGFVKLQYSTDIITVEIKMKSITFKDIFQAKAQGEIFESKYALLVSPKTIPEEIRRFIKDRLSILNFSYNKKVIIARYNDVTKDFEIDEELYYNLLPEPFKSHRKRLETAKIIIEVSKYNIQYHFSRKKVSKKAQELYMQLHKSIIAINDQIYHKFARTTITYYSPERVFLYLRFTQQYMNLIIFTNEEQLEGVENIDNHSNWGRMRVKNVSDLEKVNKALKKSYDIIKFCINNNIKTGWFAKTPKEEIEKENLPL